MRTRLLTGLAVVPLLAPAAPHEGGVGPATLRLAVSTDTLPGLAATRYRVAAGTPVAVRYTVADLGEGTFLDVRVEDPDAPSAAIRCGGGGDVIRRLTPGTVVNCAATVPAAAGARIRIVRAVGTLYWFDTPVTATAATGYVGYAAALALREEIAGRHTRPAGAPIDVQDVITNTGGVPLHDVELGGVEVRGVTVGRGCRVAVVPPGGRATCAIHTTVLPGPHLITATATAVPDLVTLRQNGSLAPAGPLTASAAVSYLGLVPTPSTAAGGAGGGAGGLGAGGVGASGARASGAGGATASHGLTGHGFAVCPRIPGPRPAATAGRVGPSCGNAALVGASRTGAGGTAVGTGGRATAPRAANANGQNAGSLAAPAHGTGPFSSSLRRRAALPLLLLVFLVILVPAVVRLTRALRRPR